MKTTISVLSITTICAFVGSYFMELTAQNIEQYFALVAVVFADGFFGIWAGTKVEGFQTRKALKVLKTLVTWLVMLTCILMIERGFDGTSWLSETIMAPFIVFELMSMLKNAERAGLVKNELLTIILSKFDKHKEVK
jgi:phage-related holin